MRVGVKAPDNASLDTKTIHVADGLLSVKSHPVSQGVFKIISRFGFLSHEAINQLSVRDIGLVHTDLSTELRGLHCVTRHC